MSIFGSRKKNAPAGSTPMLIFGYSRDAHTSTCLLTAAERDIPVTFISLATTAGTADLHAMSPLGKTPCLKDGDFITSGTWSVTTYLDSRATAKSPSLNPRKAALLGLQNYWVDVVCSNLAPAVAVLCATGSDATANHEAAAKAQQTLRAVLERLDTQLSGKDYIIGAFSFADIHTAVHAQRCLLAGQKVLVESYPNVKAWWERIGMRTNASGQRICDALATLGEVELRNIGAAA
jgi:glutathione S-transferase